MPGVFERYQGGQCDCSRVNEGAVVGNEMREITGLRSFRLFLYAILRIVFTELNREPFRGFGAQHDMASFWLLY